MDVLCAEEEETENLPKIGIAVLSNLCISFVAYPQMEVICIAFSPEGMC